VAELFVGDKVTIKSDYVNKITEIYPNVSNQVLALDLNIYVDASSDTNLFTPALGGTSNLTIRYVDTNTMKSEFVYSTSEFDSSSESSLLFGYSGDNVLFLLGLTPNGEDSFYLDSNISSDIYYSVKISYADSSDYLPVRINAVLEQSAGEGSSGSIDSNTMLKLIN
jgi:hypothetical protein